MVPKALVYTKAEHGINRALLDPDALKVIERLHSQGHQAYIVGGAVRDSILGRKPKDFDIVTDAVPNRIKRIFWNSRIIGRRFRLVHVFFGPKIIEVATFRSLKDGTVGNTFGTMDDDVKRRDFTLNALYYDPVDETIIDYCGGMKDIRKGEVKPLIPLSVIFKEDPVRMIRAVKYASSAGFSIGLPTRIMIKREAKLLKDVSVSRLSEEATKIFCSGKAATIFQGLFEYKLLYFFMPNIAKLLENRVYREAFYACLTNMDQQQDQDGERKLGKQLSLPLGLYLEKTVDWDASPHDTFPEALRLSREFLSPLNPPRVELENAIKAVYRAKGYSVKVKRRERRRGKPSGGAPTAPAAPEGNQDLA
jgi:poly(A) polymerase